MSSRDDDIELDLKTVKRDVLQKAPGYKIKLSEKQALALSETMATPGWKVLENIFVPQRKDAIARAALTAALDREGLAYYKGQVAELQLFFKVCKQLKKLAMQGEKPDEPEDDF